MGRGARTGRTHSARRIALGRGGLGPAGVVFSQNSDQVDDDSAVDKEQRHPQRTLLLKNLVHLERDQRARGGDHQVAGPIGAPGSARSLRPGASRHRRTYRPRRLEGALYQSRSTWR